MTTTRFGRVGVYYIFHSVGDKVGMLLNDE